MSAPSSLFDCKAALPGGKEYDFSELKGQAKAILVFNSASKCGFTPHLKGLQALHEQYKDRGLVVVGFPCNQFANQDPGTDDDVASFCQVNYGVSFKMAAKSDVNGKNTNETFKFLKSQKKGLIGERIMWNFTKFLVNGEGQVVARYAPTTSPESIEPEIKKLLGV